MTCVDAEGVKVWAQMQAINAAMEKLGVLPEKRTLIGIRYVPEDGADPIVMFSGDDLMEARAWAKNWTERHPGLSAEAVISEWTQTSSWTVVP
jgi:hypothetical protein